MLLPNVAANILHRVRVLKKILKTISSPQFQKSGTAELEGKM
jgi:hypothetical protein